MFLLCKTHLKKCTHIADWLNQTERDISSVPIISTMRALTSSPFPSPEHRDLSIHSLLPFTDTFYMEISDYNWFF